MDNNELFKKFEQIAAFNCFDAYQQLKDFNEEYKTSDFYKATKMKLEDAFQLYKSAQLITLNNKLTRVLDINYMASYLGQVISNIDMDSFSELAEKILNSLNAEELNEQKKELKESIDKLKLLS